MNVTTPLIISLSLLFTLSTDLYANPNHKNLTNKDKKEIRCLAKNIYFEARSESKRGQFAVAAVTMNRVKSKKYPNNICKVVWQRRQFSWTHDGKSDNPKDKKSWSKAQSLATLVYKKYFKFQSISDGAWDITRGALHYYAPRLVYPHWAKETKKTISKTQIGRHIFLSQRGSTNL